MKAFVLGAVAALFASTASAQTLHGASQFNDDHAFTKALVKFQELVGKYSGKKVEFVLHKNSELGLEKDYFAYMNQGKAVDYAIVSPAVIAYNEIYNAIQNGVIQAGENEAAGVEQMKFYEVGPNLAMTQHAITIRPLCFSGKTFKTLDKNMQQAVLRAGKEAGAYGRQIESGEDEDKLVALEKSGKLKRIAFNDRAQMKKAVDPVIEAYAKEIGAEQILAKINAIK